MTPAQAWAAACKSAALYKWLDYDSMLAFIQRNAQMRLTLSNK